MDQVGNNTQQWWNIKSQTFAAKYKILSQEIAILSSPPNHIKLNFAN